jgi:multiple sugar transport system substrate-binding protein
MKRTFTLLSLVVVLSLLAACGPTPEPQTIIQTVEVEKVVTQEVEKEVTVVETVEVEKEVTVIETVEVEVPVEATKKPLVIWSRYDLTDTEDPPSVTLAQVIETFQATTGIEVIHEQVAWDQIMTKLAVQAQSGGDMPDITEIGSQQVLALINAGALTDMSELVADAPWIDQINESEKLACVIGGERYCVAADIRGGVWYYDVADFPDGWPTTPEGWLEEGARLKDEGKYLTTFFGGRAYGAVELGWDSWIRSNGGHIVDEEGKPVWATPETIEVVEWARQLLAEGHIPEVVFTGDWSATETPWEVGDAASIRGGSWSYLFIDGLQPKFEAGETTMGAPLSFNDGPQYVFLVGEAWGIPEGAQNVEGGVAFINFFMNPQILARWAQHHYGIPTIDAAFKSGEFGGAFYQQVAQYLADYGVFMEPTPFYVETLDALAIALQELMLDPELDAATHLQEAQDEILNRYW